MTNVSTGAREPTAAPLATLLRNTVKVMDGSAASPADAVLRVGVDLGTAYAVVIATDGEGTPLAGAYDNTGAVRDGVVFDFDGAVTAVKRLRAQVEERLGRRINHAASGFPPGVAAAETRVVRNVLEAADVRCTALVAEPTAANAVLGVRDGAVVDIGGGTTGIAIFKGGRLAAVADEPTGGIHATLVISGAFRIPVEEAERRKHDPVHAAELMPVIRPVFEKIGVVVSQVIRPHAVERLFLVGGTCRFPGMDAVVSEVAAVPCVVPGDPLFVTGLGLALSDEPTGEGRT